MSSESELQSHYPFLQGRQQAALLRRVGGLAKDAKPGRVIMGKSSGGNRIVEMLVGGQLPRIC
jgi:hypothetical protein